MTSPTPCASAFAAVCGYGALASEYDSDEHETTRVLEQLSAAGLREAAAALGAGPVRRVLEIGAGTGAFTEEILGVWPDAQVVATDVSSEMLDVLAMKFAATDGRVSCSLLEAGAPGESWDRRPPELIAAGLADPYLDVHTLQALREGWPPRADLIVTVPSRSWARREREGRLGIELTTTRFRLRDGSIVFAPSNTYDERGLWNLLREGGFTALRTGVLRSSQLWSRPEIVWAVATADQR